MKTLPEDITKAGRGKVQKFLLTNLHRAHHDHPGMYITLAVLASMPEMRRTHLAAIMSAAAALRKRGLLETTVDALNGVQYRLGAHAHG